MTAPTEDLIARLPGLQDRVISDASCSHPSLTRGRVWCTVCAHTQRCDSGHALRIGWPKHCGYTMTIDSPDERAARSALTGSAQG